MSNLEQKFEALEAQTTTQHNAIMARLADTNAILNSIALALGAPPPTATVSLADVVAAIQAQTTVLSDVHRDTMSMDTKLLILRNTVSDIHLDTQSMDLKLLRIRDAISPLDENMPVEARSSILWSLYRIMDAIQPTWPRPTSIPVMQVLDLIYPLLVQMQPDVDNLQHAMGMPTGDATSTLLGLLSSVSGGIVQVMNSTGILPSPADDTVLFYLKAIKALSKCNCGATGPDSGDCSDPFKSEGMVLLPWNLIGGASQMFATFDAPLPTGITFGTTFGLADDSTELVCADWSQWQVYVTSSESQYADGNGAFSRYATNAWRRLDGSGSRVFSVRETGSISVELCNTADFTVDPGTGGGTGSGPSVTTFQAPRVPGGQPVSARYQFMAPDRPWFLVYLDRSQNAGAAVAVDDVESGFRYAVFLNTGDSYGSPSGSEVRSRMISVYNDGGATNATVTIELHIL